MALEPWVETSITRSEWGRLAIVVGGYDVSYFRSVPTQLTDISFGEPFGAQACTLVFPQITGFDQLGTWMNGGTDPDEDLTWLKEWAEVEIYKIDPDEVTYTCIFKGFVAAFNHALSDSGPVLTVDCAGQVYQLQLYRRAPQHRRWDAVVKEEAFLAAQFSTGTRAHLKNMFWNIEWPAGWALTHPSDGQLWTGFLNYETGAWQTVTDYLESELAFMVNVEDAANPGFGGTQWTIDYDPLTSWVTLKLKDITTVHHTVHHGTWGVTHDLNQDWTQISNVFYAQGSSLGSQWKSSTRIMEDLGIVRYTPLAYDDRVHDEDRVTPPNTDYTLDTYRVEAFVAFDHGVSQLDATRALQETLQRFADPGWAGTITLKVDPETTSRYDIRAGQNILYKSFNGTDTLFHISAVSISFESGIVSLTVDTHARDRKTLADVIARKAQNSRRLTRTLRGENYSMRELIFPDRVEWDYGAGSGYAPLGFRDMVGANTDVGNRPQDFTYIADTNDALMQGSNDWAVGMAKPTTDYPVGGPYVYVNGANADYNKRWVFFPVVLSERVYIEKVVFRLFKADGTAQTGRFHVGVYNAVTDIGDQPADINGDKNPLGQYAFDVTINPPNPARIIAWGQDTNAAGYSPGIESNVDPVTGVLSDEGGHQVNLPEGESVVHIAVYVEGVNCYVQGRFFNGLDHRFEDQYLDPSEAP